MLNNFYDKNLIKKPWGEEHIVYRENKVLCITLLKIKKNYSTSLHCHPKKKTGFIVLNGKARIQLGLWKKDTFTFNAPSKLMIRTGLSHSIKSVTNPYLFALEFETPVDKKDLVRFEDKYGRKLKNYEGKKNAFLLKSKDLKFKKPLEKNNQKFVFGKTLMEVKTFKNFSKIKKYKMNNIFAVIKGNVCDKSNRNILSSGDIIKTGTLIKLASRFKIKKSLTLLRVYSDK